MVKVATQTPIISLFLLILSLETSFIPSIALNLSVVAFCILFMLYYRQFKVLAWMILLAILPSFANYWAVQLHGDASQAVMLGTRAFVTVCIGLVFVSSVSLKELLLYLAQKGLSRSWAYALIVVFNSFPLIQQEIKSLKEACLLRGQELHFWSPLIYSKVLMTVFRWRHLYLRALSAHGYDEHAQVENRYRIFYISKKNKINLPAVLFITSNQSIFIKELLWNLQILRWNYPMKLGRLLFIIPLFYNYKREI